MSWTVNPSLLRLRAQIDAAHPHRDESSDGTIGNAAHQAEKSDHNPDAFDVVNAMDITHDPKNGVDCNVIAEALRKSMDPRISYVIWNKRMFSSYRAHGVLPWSWRVYNGESPHDHHMHVSAVASGKDWSIG